MRGTRRTVVWAALISILLGSGVPATREHRSGATIDDVVALARTDAPGGIDDVVVWHGAAAGWLRAKTPARAVQGTPPVRRTPASTAGTRLAIARPAIGVSHPLPLYDLHRVYRV